jgi:hypothetical protein
MGHSGQIDQAVDNAKKLKVEYENARASLEREMNRFDIICGILIMAFFK